MAALVPVERQVHTRPQVVNDMSMIRWRPARRTLGDPRITTSDMADILIPHTVLAMVLDGNGSPARLWRLDQPLFREPRSAFRDWNHRQLIGWNMSSLQQRGASRPGSIIHGSAGLSFPVYFRHFAELTEQGGLG